MSAVACGWLTFTSRHPYDLLVSSMLLGIGIGLAFAALGNLIVQAVPPQQTGVASGMNTVLRTLGGALGGQIAATFVAASTLGGLPAITGFTATFGMATVFLTACAAVALLIPSLPWPRASGDPPQVIVVGGTPPTKECVARIGIIQARLVKRAPNGPQPACAGTSAAKKWRPRTGRRLFAGRYAMRLGAAVAVAAGLAILTAACTHTYACASARVPGGPAEHQPAAGLGVPRALRASTAPPLRARLSGSGQSTPVVAVVGQRIIATVRSPGLPLHSVPQPSRPGVLCYASTVPGAHAATVVFTAWHPGSAPVLAYAGVGGCGTEELIYEVKIVVQQSLRW